MASNEAKGKQPDVVDAVSSGSRKKRRLSPVAESRPVNISRASKVRCLIDRILEVPANHTQV